MPKSTNKGELSFPRDQNLRSFPLLSDPFLSFPPRLSFAGYSNLPTKFPPPFSPQNIGPQFSHFQGSEERELYVIVPTKREIVEQNRAHQPTIRGQNTEVESKSRGGAFSGFLTLTEKAPPGQTNSPK